MVLSERAGSLKHLPRLAIRPKQRQEMSLDAEQLHYLRRVRRLQAGDAFLVADGSGQIWLARLGSGPEMAIETEVVAAGAELSVSLHMGLAVLKGSGFDENIRTLTELGVRRITPLLTSRTQLDPGLGKLERWRRIAQEAAEQCERAVWPEVDPPQPWSKWLGQIRVDLLAVAEARAEAPHLLRVLQSRSFASLAIAIGPEGGWSEAELQQAHQAQLVSLGSRILRAATAPIVAAGLVAAAVENAAHG